MASTHARWVELLWCRIRHKRAELLGTQDADGHLTLATERGDRLIEKLTYDVETSLAY